jgi:hypothetical protein
MNDISTIRIKLCKLMKATLLINALRSKFRNFRGDLKYLVLTCISNKKFMIPFCFLLLQKLSRNHLSGGLLGYKYFDSKKIYSKFFNGSILKALWVSSKVKQPDKKNNFCNSNIVTSTYFASLVDSSSEAKDDKQFRMLSILPSAWGRNKNDYGLPHCYHILTTAERAMISFFDLPTESISSNPLTKNTDSKLEEWKKIENAIIKFAPNVLMISGHKRSFDPLNKNIILNLKTKYNFKVILLLLDDWSIEYLNVVNNWGDSIDKVLVYEKNSIVSAFSNEDKILIWPFPRLVNTDTTNKFLDSNIFDIKFIGSTYLNRISWLTFIAKICSKYENINLDLSSILKSHDNFKTIGEYLDMYAFSDVTLHFLERTPGVFGFTSSVWDAFAGGALVIAQVGPENDPISDFFRPGTDYLPFNSVYELREILDYLHKNPHRIREISKSGNDFMIENYNEKKMYNYLAKKLF